MRKIDGRVAQLCVNQNCTVTVAGKDICNFNLFSDRLSQYITETAGDMQALMKPVNDDATSGKIQA